MNISVELAFTLQKKNTVGDESQGAPAKWPSSAEDLPNMAINAIKNHFIFNLFVLFRSLAKTCLFKKNTPLALSTK
jgi:hypothetical protein